MCALTPRVKRGNQKITSHTELSCHRLLLWIMLAVCGHCSSRCSPLCNSTNDVLVCLHACTWSFEIFSTDRYTFSVLLINPQTTLSFFFLKLNLVFDQYNYKEIKKEFVNSSNTHVYIRLILNWNIQSWYSWKREKFSHRITSKSQLRHTVSYFLFYIMISSRNFAIFHCLQFFFSFFYKFSPHCSGKVY